MSGQLLYSPVLWALDNAGAIIPSARAYFYSTGGTIDAPVYTTSALNVAHPQPVVADSSGQFPAIYLDPTVTYRLVLNDASNVHQADIDPLNAPFSLTADDVPDGTLTGAMFATGAVVAALGFTPLNAAGDTATGEIRLGDPATLHDDSAGFRGLPTTAQDATYTFALKDSGKSIKHTSSSAHAYTIPLNATIAFPIGTVINVVNVGSGAVTLTRASGVTLRLSSSDANVVVAQYGDCFLHKVATDDWLVSGKGLS